MLDGRNQRSFWMAAQACVVVLHKLFCVGALVDGVYALLYLRVRSQHHAVGHLVFFWVRRRRDSVSCVRRQADSPQSIDCVASVFVQYLPFVDYLAPVLV